jgi:hypothetical protein
MERVTPDFSMLVEQLVNTQMESMQAFLTPVLLLVLWTLIMWIWMYATRIPAMNKAKIDPNEARHPGTYGDRMPSNVRAVADNYNHLHEQPTLFYALMGFAALTGGAGSTMLYLAFGYVGLRVLHSLVQVLSPNVVLRFMVFSISTIVLIVMAVLEAIRVFL